MESGPEFFLEVLCLTIYSNDLDSENIVASAVKTYYDEVAKGTALNDELTKFYMSIITDVTNKNVNLSSKADVEALLIKLEQHPMVKQSPKIVERIGTLIAERANVSDHTIKHLKQKVKKWIIWVNGNNSLKKLFRTSQKVINTSDTVIQETLMNELLDRSRELTKTYEDTASTEDASVDFIDMSCAKSLKRGFDSYKKKRIDTGYTTGLQSLNRMFGRSQGPVPGEFIGFAALSHHYKSGILMDFARWMALYNEPRKENGKQAAIVFISLENEIYENMMMWFKSAYTQHYGEPPDGLSETEIINKTAELYSKRGYKLLVYRKEGDLFGYNEYRALLEELADKYTINSAILDYAGLMALPADGKDNNAKLRQELLCKMKNYANRNNILTITGFQLDTEADRIATSGTTNVVKKFGSAHLSDCKSAVKEMDFLAFMYIEKGLNGQSYLTVKWAKHKYQTTPDKHKYFAQRFEEGVGIVDDINGLDRSVVDIYSDTAEGVSDTSAVAF
jgi:hypothetical protein